MTIVRTIIAPGQRPGLTESAERVEAEGARDFLNFSGYLFSRPLPVEPFETCLDRHLDRLHDATSAHWERS